MDNNYMIRLLNDAAFMLERHEDEIPGEIVPRDGLYKDIVSLKEQARALRDKLKNETK